MTEREKAKGLRRKGKRLLTRARLWFRLKRHGVRRPFLVSQEAKRENVPLHVALALLEKETGIPQRNIFGCDYGPGEASCHKRVTRRRVAKLLASTRANGVGWTQLTYKPYVHEANAEGGAHKPRYQCRVGFRILRNLRNVHGGWRLAFQHYNGSGAAAEAYGSEAVAIAEKWKPLTR